ncbi:MAG: SGNH/GDSL hydrolase family protein, partial [Verrucomicrobiales bacterium]|nr:SGNH/GDSL hydrolase family protein [Verrucomicrobiales bacterium]
KLLDLYQPEAVIVQTGVNLYSQLRSKRRSKAGNVAEVTRLIENMCKTIKSRGASSYWIAPPQSHPDRFPVALQRELAAIMKSVVSSYGVLYESANVTRYIDPYPQNDGIHYGPTEATAWAKTVASQLLPWAQDTEPKKKRGFNPFSFFTKRSPKKSSPKPDPVVPRAVPVAKPLATSSGPGKPDRRKGSSTTPIPDVFVVKKARDANDADDEVTVEIVLRTKTNIPKNVKVDYKNALAIYEWDVLKVEDGGHYPYKKIRIAHTVYFNGRPTSAINFPTGKRWSLDLVLLSKYPGVEQWQTFDELEFDADLGIYTAKL